MGAGVMPLAPSRPASRIDGAAERWPKCAGTASGGDATIYLPLVNPLKADRGDRGPHSASEANLSVPDEKLQLRRHGI